MEVDNDCGLSSSSSGTGNREQQGSSGVDSDGMPTGLLESFGCMQTLDKADLISQVKRLVGGESNGITDEAAAFYLEANQWNVSEAVGAYFDLEAGAKVAPPQMTFVKDVTIGEGESVPPGTHFTKTWTVQNTGTEQWPEGVQLRFSQGHAELAPESHRPVPVSRLLPWQRADISVELRSPSAPGIYESKWRLSTDNGLFFGDTIWAIITVERSGTLALTQQMNNFNSLGSDSSGKTASGAASGGTSDTTNNPFANPIVSQPQQHPDGGGGGGEDQDMN